VLEKEGARYVVEERRYMGPKIQEMTVIPTFKYNGASVVLVLGSFEEQGLG
jgi:hypothetical protein